MPLHVFKSSLARMSFQPGCSNKMIDFVNHEAVIEDAAVAAELDLLISQGRLESIRRVTAADKQEEVEQLEAQLAALRAAKTALQEADAGPGKTTVGVISTAEMTQQPVTGGVATDKAGNTKSSKDAS